LKNSWYNDINISANEKDIPDLKSLLFEEEEGDDDDDVEEEKMIDMSMDKFCFFSLYYIIRMLSLVIFDEWKITNIEKIRKERNYFGLINSSFY